GRSTGAEQIRAAAPRGGCVFFSSRSRHTRSWRSCRSAPVPRSARPTDSCSTCGWIVVRCRATRLSRHCRRGGPPAESQHDPARRSLYDDVVTMRAWLTAVVVALSLLVAGPTSTASADDGALTVRIDALTPSQLNADATIRMRGTIRNTGSTPWTAVQAYLVIPRFPFQSREQIETAIEDGQSYTGERIVDPGTFDEVGDIAPGASVTFDIAVPVSRIGLAGEGGVYPVGVQILATDAEGF